MNKKIIAKNGKLTTPLFCLLVAGNLVGCEVDKEEETFDLDSYKVTTNVSDGGKISLASALFKEGDVVSITLTADEGYELESISGCEGTLLENVYTTSAITASCEVEVDYMLERVAVSISATEGGSADMQSQLINPGSKAIFNLTANEGYDIGEVTGCEGTLEEGTYTTSPISSACDVSASFVAKTFAVTTDVSAGGSVDLTSQMIAYGSKASITLTADESFEISAVSGCEGSLSGNVYTTAILVETCEVSVNFAEKGVLLTGIALTSLAEVFTDVELMQFTATASYSNTTTDDVSDKSIWTVSDNNIATIDDNGLVTPLKAGMVTVSVSYTDHTGTSSNDVALTITPSLQIIGDRGGNAFAARKTDGTVVTWGDVTRGGDSSSVAAELTDVHKIATNRYAFAAIKNDGTVVSWGDVSAGSDSSGVEGDLTNVVEITANRTAFAALKADGTVVTWGDAAVGGDSSSVQAQLTGVVSITSNIYAFAALKTDGTVVTWGTDGRGATSDSTIIDQLVGVTKLVSNYRGFAALKDDNTIVSWGHDSYIGDYQTLKDAGTLVNIKDISANLYAFAATKTDGSMVAWGYSGRGDDISAIEASLVDVVSVENTGYAFAALKEDESVITWGQAASGGDSSGVSASLTGVASITGSLKAFAAIKKDGSVVTWGDSSYGGDSSSVTASLVDVASVSASYQAFAALKNDGTVVTWGLVGNGADSSAVQALLTDVASLVSNRYAFAALKADGTVVTWGGADKGGDSSAVNFD